MWSSTDGGQSWTSQKLAVCLLLPPSQFIQSFGVVGLVWCVFPLVVLKKPCTTNHLINQSSCECNQDRSKSLFVFVLSEAEAKDFCLPASLRSHRSETETTKANRMVIELI